MCYLGRITSPPEGKNFLFLPGKTEKIQWIFDDPISSLVLRSWSFISSDGSLRERLATISENETTKIVTKLFDIDIERPATLVLRNINQSYYGMYVFTLAGTTTFTSSVNVSIASKY